MVIKFLNKLLIPFAIIHIRLIQWRYKHITVKHVSNRTNSNTQTLILLQAKEYYYKQQFSPWGKFNPKFVYSCSEDAKHKKFMDWLFPKKHFVEWEIVNSQKPEVITYYYNQILKLLNKTKFTVYHTEILENIKEWERQSRMKY